MKGLRWSMFTLLIFASMITRPRLCAEQKLRTSGTAIPARLQVEVSDATSGGDFICASPGTVALLAGDLPLVTTPTTWWVDLLRQQGVSLMLFRMCSRSFRSCRTGKE